VVRPVRVSRQRHRRGAEGAVEEVRGAGRGRCQLQGVEDDAPSEGRRRVEGAVLGEQAVRVAKRVARSKEG